MSCRLRRVSRADLEMVMQWRMLPEITQNMYTDPHLTLDDQVKWFERIQASDHDMVWIIELTEPALPVGLLSLSEIDRVHQRSAWAYYVANPEARGKGLAKLLECNIYDYVFTKMGLRRLWCEVFSFNERVISLHEHFGSKVEGVLRQHIYKNGISYDVARMAILRDEWLAKREKFKCSRIEIE